jgi:hypothetical protein
MAGRPRYKSGPKKGKFMSNRAIAASKRARSAKRPAKKTTALATTRGRNTSMAKKRGKRRGGKRRGGSRNGLPMAEIKDLMVGGAIYGYITNPDASEAASEETGLQLSMQSALSKMPNIGNRDISNGVALYLIDKHVWSNKYLRATAKAALVSGAVRFGRQGFKLGGSELGGWDDAADVTEQGEHVSGIYD